jgi:UDP-N-acetylmuramoylalanine--D-glutamate ligase
MAPPKKYSTFCFESFEIKLRQNRIIFHYSVDNEIFFDPELELDLSPVKNISQIEAAVFNLGMAEIPSFYKTVCTPEIIVKAGPLTGGQIKFWENLYTQGLGEFFYKNKIDFRGLINIQCPLRSPVARQVLLPDKSCCPTPCSEDAPCSEHGTRRYLVPLGGGKDSIVAAESLKAKGIDFTWFMLEPWPVCKKVIRASGNPKKIEIHRDPARYFKKVIELNQKGFYNGHVPITSVYIFSAALAAQIHGFTDIVLASERSANHGNLKYLGREINHQYSKSFEFEKACHKYIRKFISPGLNFYSILRNLYEIQITEKFTRYPQYFNSFLSCNRGLKSNKGWCCKCAKCAFVFAMLSAFLPSETVAKIFGKNLFQDESLLGLFEELLGRKNFKPFDCVGEPEEVLLALYLAKQQYISAPAPADPALSTAKIRSARRCAHLKDQPHPSLPAILKKLDLTEGKKYLHLLKADSKQHLIPRHLFTKNQPAQDQTKIAIAGFGMEGQALYRHFRNTHQVHIFDQSERSGLKCRPKQTPSRQGLLADKSCWPTGLVKFHRTLTIPADFPIVYKSPGIPTRSLKLQNPKTQISSLTNLFFEKAKGTIIGVTGTKGKSTTSSLIYHILKTAGYPVELIGNIGETGLKSLHKNSPEKIYVYELSSYQCEHLTRSPHIAIVTNLYPEHLSNHGSFEAYKKAKAKICAYQKRADYLIINSEIAAQFKTPAHKINLKGWGQPQRFSQLAGAHNQFNIQLAATAARLLKVPEATITKAVATFKPLPGRLEKVATRRGITFYDDALATIPEATWHAIQTLKNVNTIILGGQDRGLNFDNFARQLTQTSIKNFIYFPDTGPKMVKYLKPKMTPRPHAGSPSKMSPNPNVAPPSNINSMPAAAPHHVYPAKDMRQAVQLAYKHTKGICLLSTASPSFNMFKNYKDRSEQYLKWIKKLA